MSQIPDADYIREAEMYGMPSAEYPECPVCGKVCHTIFADRDSGDVYGCDRCVKVLDAADWLENQKMELEEMYHD